MTTVSQARLPYDDASSPHEMYADCAAAGGNLGLDPFARGQATHLQHPVAHHHRFAVAVPASAARMARDLHLHVH